MGLEPIENLIGSYEAYVSIALVEGEGLEDEARLNLITRNVIEDQEDLVVSHKTQDGANQKRGQGFAG